MKHGFEVDFGWLAAGLLAGLFLARVVSCGNEPAAVATMTDEQIIATLVERYDSVQEDKMRIILSDIEDLRRTLRTRTAELSDAQREVLSRIDRAERTLRRQGAALQSFSNVRTQTIVEREQVPVVVRDTVRDVDTVTISTFDYKDEWVQLRVHQDSVAAWFRLSVRDEFDLLQYEQDGQYYAEVQSRNPYTYVRPGTTVFKLDVPQRQRRWGVGLFAGVAVSGRLRPIPAAGVGLIWRPRLSINLPPWRRRK